MSYSYDFFDNPYTQMLSGQIRRRPKCRTCTNEKLGLETVCEKYKKIPVDVQHGGYCDYYNMTKSELDRIEKREMEEYNRHRK